MGSRTWIKIYTDKWIQGTLREETAEIRGVWVDLLALAGNGKFGDTGEIKLAPDVSFTDEQIAQILVVPEELWYRAKQRLIETERINITSKGIIAISNWQKYQSEYRRQKPYREKDSGGSPPPPLKKEEEEKREKEKEKESEKPSLEVTSESYNKEETLQGDKSPSLYESALKNCSGFEDYRNLLEVYPDKVAFLVNAFRKLHPGATAEDLQGCGGRLAGMWSRKNKDAGFILKVIWDTSSNGIAGSHLDYIQKVLFKDGKQQRDDVEKFFKGKYGHMVRS